VPVRFRSRGMQVRAAEELLRAKMLAPITVDGYFGRNSVRATKRFQKRVGLRPTGRIGQPTWQALVGHFERVDLRRPGLCDYDVRGANWGTSATVATIERAAQILYYRTRARVAVGDISREMGGDIALHRYHEQGLEVDLRPIRKDRRNCSSGTNWRSRSYDRKATKALILAIRRVARRNLNHIAFNDPVLVRQRLTRRWPGHDDHLHVRFCEPSHPVRSYRC
jgi:hypothetical protein